MPQIKGNQLFLDVLRQEGVRYLFGNPGATEVPWLDLLPDYPELQYVLALHEDIALAMADGYALASGQVGVATVHATPGTAHALGNLFNASVSGSPVVVLVGQVHSGLLIGEPFLASDLLQMTRQYVKWCCQVSRVEELPLALHRAFKVASDPPTGPALVAVPVELHDQTMEGPLPAFTRHKLTRTMAPEGSAILRAAELLAAAERPALVCGPGVVRSGAVPMVTELAEKLGIRVYGDARFPVCFPTTHPMYAGLIGPKAIAACDVLMVVGQKMFLDVRFPQTPVPPHVKVIHLDVDPWEIGKNYPVEVGIVSDPKLGLQALSHALAGEVSASAQARYRRRVHEITREGERTREQHQREVREYWDKVPISAQRLTAELQSALPRDALLVVEASTTHAYIRRLFECAEPDALYRMVGGSLGWGLGAALGVKLARPEREVVAVVGDGTFMYYPQALWTGVRYNLPVLTVICNNRCYLNDKFPMFQRQGPSSRTGDYACVDITGPDIDFVKLAQGVGACGEHVESPDNLGAALRRGLAAGSPAVVDVSIAPWQFEGS
ncbi:MAG: thiamine pyrophosphate-binding protein [Chloroflexi bacterium]|nr:thiamine pyrophosphate-binding protein [Chloroflexota bacterium]